jgi:hypothetical protein
MILRILMVLFLTRAGIGWSADATSASALAAFAGSELEGGAKDVVGTSFLGEEVNTVYAAATGAQSTMRVKFMVSDLPAAPLFVHLKARDDDAPRPCAIAIRLNEKSVFEGGNPFSAEKFEARKFPIPEGALVSGENILVISCLEKEGRSGMPPWFQVANCVVAPEKFVIRPELRKSFYVELPREKRDFPEPLPAGREPGFKFRGTKGWAWRPDQYLAEIPWLARFKMNFLMNCYISMFDIEHHANWADGEANRWWEEIPAEKKRAYEEVVRACQRQGIEFCFGMNPNLVSKRMVNDHAPDSVDQLYQHYAWMQGLGVKWFNISLDDITQGIDASSHARVVNTIFKRLRVKDPAAQMIFCPTWYWGDGTDPAHQPYLKTLARELDAEIYLFWTGDSVVGRISRAGAETYRRISGHRLFLWDNYPVNDDQPTMHLGPVVDRDSDLCEVVDGYMGNPHRKQNEINRLPLATCADYAYNPWGYDPGRSIGQAILQVAERPAQRETLRDLVEAYPGMLICSPPQRGTGFNAVQDQFAHILAVPRSRPVALAYLEHLRRLSRRLATEFPEHYSAERETLDRDIQILNAKFKAKYP